jgi:tetratricopeptide (TPR) repeat protein
MVAEIKKETIEKLLFEINKIAKTKFEHRGIQLTHGEINNRLGKPKRCRKLGYQYKRADNVQITPKWYWTLIILLSVSCVLALSGLYSLKKNSADGHLLIWKCSLKMIKDKPVQGFGQDGFKTHYMNYQVKYFEEHPDSKQAMLADNYRQTQQYKEAEQHYINASNMCPVKFMPLHQLVEVYDETGHREEALSLARKIIDKEVKRPSSTVSVIKQKMRQLIEKSDAEKVNETESVPASESRTSDQPQTPKPWPGGFSDTPYATRPP